MADYIDNWDQIELYERIVRREATIRDRLNPFTYYDDGDFLIRYRLRKDSVMNVLHDIRPMIEGRGQNGSSIPAYMQFLVALRFYANGCFLRADGDMFGIHQSTVSRIIKRVSVAIASLKGRFITFPTGNRARAINQGFSQISGIPGVVGAIDCTHIPIQSPGGHFAELFRNRKGYFSINVQAICDDKCEFTNIVVRWPGSKHDSRIFDTSEICAMFENNEVSGVLLGDNGYPLRRYLLTPLLQCNTRAERRYNYALCQARVKIENLFGTWKRRFPCLRYTLRLKLYTTLIVIVACAVLHNLARRENVAMPADGGDQQLPPEDVPVHPPHHRLQGGHAFRAVLIRHFEWYVQRIDPSNNYGYISL